MAGLKDELLADSVPVVYRSTKIDKFLASLSVEDRLEWEVIMMDSSVPAENVCRGMLRRGFVVGATTIRCYRRMRRTHNE